MKKPILPVVLLLSSLVGCVTLQPRVTLRQDPFTGVQSKIMTVGESDGSIFLNQINTIQNPYAKTRLLPTNHYLDITISQGDTTMTFVKLLPEKWYYVPGEGKMQIKLFDNNNVKGYVASLPIVKSYHTSGGPLVITARVDARTVQALQRSSIDVIRIDKVSVNESDENPIDWYPATQYSFAFRKGAGMLFSGSGITPKKRR
jgi:hypothetical protein